MKLGVRARVGCVCVCFCVCVCVCARVLMCVFGGYIREMKRGGPLMASEMQTC